MVVLEQKEEWAQMECGWGDGKGLTRERGQGGGGELSIGTGHTGMDPCGLTGAPLCVKDGTRSAMREVNDVMLLVTGPNSPRK